MLKSSYTGSSLHNPQSHPGCLHPCTVVALTHWGRSASCHSPLSPVPLLGRSPHTWGWAHHIFDDGSGSLWSR